MSKTALSQGKLKHRQFAAERMAGIWPAPVTG